MTTIRMKGESEMFYKNEKREKNEERLKTKFKRLLFNKDLYLNKYF